MSIRPLRWLLLSILAISINTSVASASELVISSLALGERTEDVPGIESMSQEDIARQAALLALAPEGCNLESPVEDVLRATVPRINRVGMVGLNGPPMKSPPTALPTSDMT